MYDNHVNAKTNVEVSLKTDTKSDLVLSKRFLERTIENLNTSLKITKSPNELKVIMKRSTVCLPCISENFEEIWDNPSKEPVDLVVMVHYDEGAFL